MLYFSMDVTRYLVLQDKRRLENKIQKAKLDQRIERMKK